MRMLTETELTTVAGGQTYEEIHEKAMEFCREIPTGTYTVVTPPKEAKVKVPGVNVGGAQGGVTVTVNCSLGRADKAREDRKQREEEEN